MRYLIEGQVSVDGGAWEHEHVMVEVQGRRPMRPAAELTRAEKVQAGWELKRHVALHRTRNDDRRVKVRRVKVTHFPA